MSDRPERIEEIAVDQFEKLDLDQNGYLSSAELQFAKQSSDAKSHLVAEALLQNYDWIAMQSDDQLLQETQITKKDIAFIGAFRDESDVCSEVIAQFNRLDFNKDGHISQSELDDPGVQEKYPGLIKFFRTTAYPNPRYYKPSDRPSPTDVAWRREMLLSSMEQQRMWWIAGLSDDQWLIESQVTNADLTVFQRGTKLVRQMDAVLNSKRP